MNEETPAANTSDNWLILNCPSCEKEVKLRSGTDLDSAACPYCSEFLGDSSPANDGGEADTPDPADKNAPDAVSEVERDWQGDEPTRIKRRSKPSATVEEPEWDRDPDDPKRRVDDEDTTEFVEVDPENPDAVRVRRVKRTKIVTPAQKLFRISLLAFMLLVGAGGLTLLIIAIVQGTSTVTKDIQTVAALPDKVQELIEAARSEGFIPSELTEAETKAAEAIARGYLEAEGWEAKLPYVYRPERVGPLMESWYARSENSDAKVPTRTLKLRDKLVEKDPNGDRYIIKLAIETHPGTYEIMALRQTPEDIKVHWESTVRYQKMTLAEFKEKRPTEPTPFRLKIQADSYYNNAFADKEVYQCVIMVYPGDPDFKLFGYLRRDNPTLEPLLRSLALGSPSVILNLRYPPVSEEDNQVEIVSVVDTTWFN